MSSGMGFINSTLFEDLFDDSDFTFVSVLNLLDRDNLFTCYELNLQNKVKGQTSSLEEKSTEYIESTTQLSFYFLLSSTKGIDSDTADTLYRGCDRSLSSSTDCVEDGLTLEVSSIPVQRCRESCSRVSSEV
jgi:hypothetical protein